MDQPAPGVGVVIGPEEGLLKPPVRLHPRRGLVFQLLELAQRGVDPLVGDQRSAPVAFQGHQSLRESLGVAVTDEIPAELPQHINHPGVRIPIQRTPHRLVHIVIATLGIADEPHRVRLEQAHNRRLIHRARIDAFASLGDRKRGVPIRHRILALAGVGDVGIMPDRIGFRHRRTQLREAHPHLGSKDDSAQPFRLLHLEDLEEFLQPNAVEALRRDPHLGLRVGPVKRFGLLLQQRHQLLRRRVAGISSGDKHRIDPGKLSEHLRPFPDRRFHGLGVGIILVHCRIPDPDIEPVVVGQLRHPGHHPQRRQRKVRAVGVVIRAGRDQFNRVGAKDDQIPIVLLPGGQVPGVVGMCLRTVTELMPAQWVARGR